MHTAQLEDPPNPFLLTGDVARLLHVSPVTVRQWERTGRLRAVRTARGVRLFERAAVDRLLLERQRSMTLPMAGDR